MKLQAISAAVVAVLANRGPLRAEQPVIQSVLNAASFTTAVAPGTWVTIFGNGLASDIAIGQTTPYPVQLNGVTVTVGGVAAPVSYVSPTQVNALIPYEAATVSATQRVTAPVIVTNGSAASAPFNISLTRSAPAIYTKTSAGTGDAIAFDSNFQPVTNADNGPIILYLNGLGPTNPPIATAALGASAEPLNRVQDGVSVSLGDVSATVLYAGVAPMYQGIYQINVLPNGPLSNRLTVFVDGLTSNSVTLPVPAGTNVTNLTGSIDGLYPATTGLSSAGPLTFTALLNAATFETSFDIVPDAKPFQITARSSTFGTNGFSPTAVISVDPVLNTWQATLTVPAAPTRAYQFSSPIYDLLTGAPFPGNVIPLTRRDPAAVMAIDSLALPTTPSSDGFDATFSASGTLPAVGPFRINSTTLSELANFGGFVQLPGRFYGSGTSFTTTYQLFVDGLLVASKTAVISTP